MNCIQIILLFVVFGSDFLHAQIVKKDSKKDPILKAIAAFNTRDKASENEIKVILDPVGLAQIPTEKTPPTAKQTPKASPTSEPVLVTGKQREETDHEPKVFTITDKLEGAPSNKRTELPPLEQDVEVSVEKLQTGEKFVDPKTIKLLAPFPAKPLASPPNGWHLVSSERAPSFTRKIEIAQGTQITLTIRPHLLVPNSDGSKTFSISEIGYEAPLGYQQDSTVGAILSKSLRELDENSKHLGNAINSLQQLLISLPKSESSDEQKLKSLPVTK
jgi:hypothetical protein